MSLQAIKQFLEEVNCQRKDTTAGPIPWNTAVKFLMARKFDVKRAIDLFKAHEVRQTLTQSGFPPYLENLELCHFLFEAWKMPGIYSKSSKNLEF